MNEEAQSELDSQYQKPLRSCSRHQVMFSRDSGPEVYSIFYLNSGGEDGGVF
jgi:hypothetical protein